MKKTIFLLLMLILLSVSAQAALISYIQTPIDNPKTIKFGENITFQSYAINGSQPYNYEWVFCSTCNPTESNAKNPGEVKFNNPGTFNVSYNVTDDDSQTKTDSVIINVVLSNITYPQNNTYWSTNESIPFQGQGEYINESTTFNYLWDFGDITVNNNFAAERTNQNPSGIKYPSIGTYVVFLTVTHPLTSSIQTSNITIKIIEPIDKNFTCSVKQGVCSTFEIELLRLFQPNNSHVRSIDDLDKDMYVYSLCCESKNVIAKNTTDTNSPGIYLTFETSTDSQLGGFHSIQETLSSQYYEITSNEGAGPQCQKYFLGLNGKCSDINKKCVYEFYPEQNSQVSNCTEPNSFGSQTWAMCCAVEEDCTNNVDDNNNIWFDCKDSDVCSVLNNERACGVSNELLQDPTCSWMNSECTEDGCDFSSYSNPYWDNNLQTYGFELPTTSYPLCKVYFLNDIWQFNGTDCAPGTNESNILIPQSAIDAISGVNTKYFPFYNTTAKELYFKCRYYYCSVGKDQNKPLPAFVEDMAENGQNARHCCPLGTYWDPSTLNDFGEPGKCVEFAQCYDLFDTSNEYACQSDFLTEFSTWKDDVYGATNPIHDPEDCIRDDMINSGTMEKTLCCPVWKNNENTYDMTDISYFIVP